MKATTGLLTGLEHLGTVAVPRVPHSYTGNALPAASNGTWQEPEHVSEACSNKHHPPPRHCLLNSPSLNGNLRSPQTTWEQNPDTAR